LWEGALQLSVSSVISVMGILQRFVINGSISDSKPSSATNRFTDMGCDYCVEKPKSYAAPAGDPGIGLEQLELMCKV
ncbi:hypothetical protein HID58_058791, partial [Brassica napus]